MPLRRKYSKSGRQSGLITITSLDSTCLNAHLNYWITWCKMWCHPGLSCRVTNVQAMPLLQRAPSIPPALCCASLWSHSKKHRLRPKSSARDPELVQPGSAATWGNALLPPGGHLHLTLGPEHQQLSHPTQGLPGSNLIPISASGSSLCGNGPGVSMTGAD